MSFISGIGRKLVYLGVIAAMGVVALPHNSQAAPADQGKSRTFPETGKTVSGRILEVWEGGRAFEDSLMINGLPLTDLADQQSLEDGKIYKTQWFERARFELHPENKAPYDVLLGRLGAYVAEGRKDAPFKGIDNPGGGVSWFPETKHSLGDSTEGGKAIAAFWNKYGGLAQFGFPLSQPFQEVSKTPASTARASWSSTSSASASSTTRRTKAASLKSFLAASAPSRWVKSRWS
jgi:hypothetical protein